MIWKIGFSLSLTVAMAQGPSSHSFPPSLIFTGQWSHKAKHLKGSHPFAIFIHGGKGRWRSRKKKIHRKKICCCSIWEDQTHQKGIFVPYVYVYELWRQKMNEITFKMCFNDRKEDYVPGSFVQRLAQPIQSTVAETQSNLNSTSAHHMVCLTFPLYAPVCLLFRLCTSSKDHFLQ